VDAAREDAVEDLACQEQRGEHPPDRARRGPVGEERGRGWGGRRRRGWRGGGTGGGSGGGREGETGNGQAAAWRVEAEEVGFRGIVGGGKLEERVSRGGGGTRGERKGSDEGRLKLDVLAE
jgi:hypothetical protein